MSATAACNLTQSPGSRSVAIIRRSLMLGAAANYSLPSAARVVCELLLVVKFSDLAIVHCFEHSRIYRLSTAPFFATK